MISIWCNKCTLESFVSPSWQDTAVYFTLNNQRSHPCSHCYSPPFFSFCSCYNWCCCHPSFHYCHCYCHWHYCCSISFCQSALFPNLTSCFDCPFHVLFWPILVSWLLPDGQPTCAVLLNCTNGHCTFGSCMPVACWQSEPSHDGSQCHTNTRHTHRII